MAALSVDALLGPAPAGKPAPKAAPRVDDILGAPPKPQTPVDVHTTLNQVFGGRVQVTSADRTPKHNREVGGVPGSAHLTRGGAYDLTGLPAAEIARQLKANGAPGYYFVEGDHLHWQPNGRHPAPVKEPTAADILGPPHVDDVLGPAPTTRPPASSPRSPPSRAPDLHPSVGGFVNYLDRAGSGFTNWLNAGQQPANPQAAGQMISHELHGGQLRRDIKADEAGALRQQQQDWNDPRFFHINRLRTPIDLFNRFASPLNTMASKLGFEPAARALGTSPNQLQAATMIPAPEMAGAHAEQAGSMSRALAEGIPGAARKAAPTVRGTEEAIAAARPGAAPKPRGAPRQARVLNEATGSRAAPMVDEILGPAPKPNPIREASQAVRRVLAPATVDPDARATAQTIRRASAEGDLAANQAADRLVKHANMVDRMPVEQQRAIVRGIEQHSSGLRLNPELQTVVNDIRGVYKGYKDRIGYILGTSEEGGPGFIRDYYTHMWQNAPNEVEAKMGAWFSRQGTGRNLKARTIPTLQEGIEAGLTPRYENPIHATMVYANNMSRFLATHDIQNEMKTGGLAEYHPAGGAPEGWVPLDGIMTAKPGRTIIKDGETTGSVRQEQLYAPEGAARVYNNFISKGLEGTAVGPFYRVIRATENTLVGLKLGLSAFHASVMGQEGIISEVARGINAGLQGKPVTSIKAILGSPTAPVRLAVKGSKLRGELLSEGARSPVAEAFVRSGGRLRMDPMYRVRSGLSYYEAAKRDIAEGITNARNRGVRSAMATAMRGGAFTRELQRTASALRSKPLSTTFETLGNVIQSISGPLFEDYIPAVKRGAFYERMGDWLKAHPEATREETDAFSIKLQDSMDSRFGELVQDNLFWHRWLKQIAQIAFTSSTWDLGTLREIGGGIADAPKSLVSAMKGKGVSERTAYVLALGAVATLQNAIMTYMKTGTAPEGMDFVAYRTGGTDARTGQPERALIPGYMKDVLGWINALGHGVPGATKYIGEKMSPAVQMARDYATNTDYRGLPIYNDWQTAAEDFAQRLMPISVNNAVQGPMVGSNISPLESTLSIRPAPRWVTDPDGSKAMDEKYSRLNQRKRERSDARMRSRLENQQ